MFLSISKSISISLTISPSMSDYIPIENKILLVVKFILTFFTEQYVIGFSLSLDQQNVYVFVSKIYYR